MGFHWLQTLDKYLQNFFFFFYKFGNSTFNIVSKDHQAEVLLVKQVLATHVHASQTDLVNFNNQSLKLFRITK